MRALGPTPIRAAVDAFLASPHVALPADALAALDTVARQRRAADPAHWAAVGRNFVSRELVRNLGAGLEVWLGYSLSVRPTQPCAGRSLLSAVVDRAAAAFVKAQSVEHYIAEVTNYHEPAPGSLAWKKAHKALKGIKVQIQTGDATTRRQYRCSRGLTRLPASQCVFPNAELGRDDNVAAYFARKLGRALRYPNLPCVDVSRSAARQILLPLELCTVVAGQRRQLVDDPAASAAMIKETVLRPADRRTRIERDVAAHVAADATMAAFGMAVAPRMRKLSGRVLPQPKLQYRQSVVTPQGGAWNMQNNVLHSRPAQPPQAWAVVCVDRRDEARVRAFLPPFAAAFSRTAGFALPAQPRFAVSAGGETLEDTLARAVQGSPRVGFVLCVLDGSADTYERVKSLYDQQLGVVSQCMLPKHLGGGDRGPNPQYMANLTLKINAKLGGTNVVVARPQGGVAIPGLSEAPTMLFGADVSHPSPGSASPSVEAVVGSLDATAARYATRLATQPATQEHISALQSMSAELLREFEAVTRHRPGRVIFFRDGVSEGQFQQVLRTELPALRDAFASLGDGSYRPKLTFVVLQKRHHTRLFVENAADADRSGNVPPVRTRSLFLMRPSDEQQLRRACADVALARCAGHGGGHRHLPPARARLLPGLARGHPGHVPPGALPRAARRERVRRGRAAAHGLRAVPRVLPLHAQRQPRAARLLRAPGGVPRPRAARGRRSRLRRRQRALRRRRAGRRGGGRRAHGRARAAAAVHVLCVSARGTR